jgi:hypothetical protein
MNAGDLSYAQGFGYGWEVYQDMMAPLIANMPYMVVEGYHSHHLHTHIILSHSTKWGSGDPSELMNNDR